MFINKQALVTLLISVTLYGLGIQNALAAPPRPAPARPPAPAGGGGGGSKEITEALNVTGQARNLSMGLLLQKQKGKLTFGTPRTNYRDKISSKQTNF